jgi:hypothetical protein
MRGVQRVFGVSRPTLAKWLKKKMKVIQNQKRLCFQHKQTMNWN